MQLLFLAVSMNSYSAFLEFLADSALNVWGIRKKRKQNEEKVEFIVWKNAKMILNIKDRNKTGTENSQAQQQS
jgi:hypothetical protein